MEKKLKESQLHVYIYTHKYIWWKLTTRERSLESADTLLKNTIASYDFLLQHKKHKQKCRKREREREREREDNNMKHGIPDGDRSWDCSREGKEWWMIERIIKETVEEGLGLGNVKIPIFFLSNSSSSVFFCQLGRNILTFPSFQPFSFRSKGVASHFSFYQISRDMNYMSFNFKNIDSHVYCYYFHVY